MSKKPDARNVPVLELESQNSSLSPWTDLRWRVSLMGISSASKESEKGATTYIIIKLSGLGAAGPVKHFDHVGRVANRASKVAHVDQLYCN